MTEADYTRWTWRYLRLAMIGIVAVLGVAVMIEHFKVRGECFQTSISAYYYTPARAIFVGSLIAIGVCMVCLRGSTDVENRMLNFAGMFAAVVALVPTPHQSGCSSLPQPTHETAANVANNILALLVISGVALLIASTVALRPRRYRGSAIAAAVGVVSAWLAAALAFALARHFFIHSAHYAAAVAMFICIFLVAIANAYDSKGKRYKRNMHAYYVAISALMVAAAAAGGVGGIVHWKHTVIAVEAALISLFAALWIAQTVDLWGPGLRPRMAESTA